MSALPATLPTHCEICGVVLVVLVAELLAAEGSAEYLCIPCNAAALQLRRVIRDYNY